jgi:hypothetical protein
MNDEIRTRRRRKRGNPRDGHATGSLQSWNALPAASRHPVSPNIRIRCGLGRTSGSVLPSSTPAIVPGGTAISQPRTLNSAGFTLSNFWSGSERTAIGMAVPSNTTDGHPSSVIARTLDVPSGPTSTHCDSTLASAAPPPANARATMARAASR